MSHMAITQHDAPTTRKPLRLWPGVVIVTLQWLLAFGVPLVAPDAEIASLPIGMLAVMGGALGGLAIIVWWLLFSRAPWSERVGAIVLILAVMSVRDSASTSRLRWPGWGCCSTSRRSRF